MSENLNFIRFLLFTQKLVQNNEKKSILAWNSYGIIHHFVLFRVFQMSKRQQNHHLSPLCRMDGDGRPYSHLRIVLVILVAISTMLLRSVTSLSLASSLAHFLTHWSGDTLRSDFVFKLVAIFSNTTLWLFYHWWIIRSDLSSNILEDLSACLLICLNGDLWWCWSYLILKKKIWQQVKF